MKAVLVIEMPKTCKDCKLTYLDTGDDAYYGSPTQRCIFDGAEADVNERYYDCPLRPLPQKKNTSKLQGFGNSQIVWTDRTIYQNEGWNECIDAITGETE